MMRTTTLKILFMATLLNANSAFADELVYVFGPECGACRKFQKEAGAIYPKTEAAGYLPLSKITLEDWQTGEHLWAHCDTKPVYGTPTFLQISQCREVDRITGYSNDELFWFALERMLNRSKAAQ